MNNLEQNCRTGKRSYRKITAQTVRNKRKKKGTLLRIYFCPECNFWHLTKKL